MGERGVPSDLKRLVVLLIVKLSPLLCLAAALWLVNAVAAASQTLNDGAAVSPADPQTEARLSAQRQLTEALARIAADSSDWFALSQAGRAAVALGDGRTAVGFLARAEGLAPRDPIIKAAMGAALVQLEDPEQAMRYFDAAISAGGLDRTYIADRGLAFDLMGLQARARADYAVAAQAHPSAELTRRHAISLGIDGHLDQAVQMLGPLLRAQDRAAWRSRAMILAMNGRAEEARQIARATMPRQLADGLEPYFGLMDRLTPGQLAAASHFGRFPSYDVVRSQPSRAAARVVVVAATPAGAAPASRSRDRPNPRRNTTGTRRTEVAVATVVPLPVPIRSTSSAAVPTLSSAPPPPPPVPPAPLLVSRPVVQPLPASTSAPVSALIVVTVEPAIAAPARAIATTVPAPSAPPPDTRVVAGWSLDAMVAAIEVPAAERSTNSDALSIEEIQAIAAAQRLRLSQAAATARATARTDAETRRRTEAETRRRAEAEAAAREEAERLRRNPARIWVQIATGSDVSALGYDCRRLARQYASSFSGQSCASAVWNRTRRLVVGPFRNAAAARSWLSAYSTAGGEGFVWNSDAGEEVTPMGRSR